MYRGRRSGIQRARESFQSGWSRRYHREGGIQAARAYTQQHKGAHLFFSVRHTDLFPNYPL